MRLKDYLQDKLGSIFIILIGFVISILLLNAFKVDNSLKVALVIIYFSVVIICFSYDFLRKYWFYNTLVKTIEGLDKKYLVTEMINEPNFLEGKIFYQALYEINKDYLEEIFKNDMYSDIHGDLTIENIICITGKNDFYIIDPNTGNLHDSPNLDYAKLLQSLHGGYEFLMNTKSVEVNQNNINYLFTKSVIYDELYM